jgi:hypothetical protein
MGTGASTIISGLSGAYSQYSQGQTSASGYESSAKQTEWQRDQQISALKGQTESTVSSGQAALAANGMDIGSVTSQNIEVGTRTNANLDEAAIRYNANVQALQLRSQGNQAKSAGTISGLSTLVGTASQTATGYSEWKKTSAGANGGFVKYLTG